MFLSLVPSPENGPPRVLQIEEKTKAGIRRWGRVYQDSKTGTILTEMNNGMVLSPQVVASLQKNFKEIVLRGAHNAERGQDARAPECAA